MKPRVSARYYCESCGTEVSGRASSCPTCGSVFTAVRCPECGHEGRASEFRSGCPVCGYRTKSMEALRAGPAAGRARLHLPPVFYRAAVVVLGALILGLLLLLVLKA
ncbi:MAG: double zinc ribbon domain-containing protein [Spirochaetia bacterium]